MAGQNQEEKDVEPLDSRKDSFVFSKRLVRSLEGLIFVLLGLIAFVGKGPVGSFLAYCLAYAFGVFLYPILVGIILLGLFMIFEGRFPRFRINFTGLGYLLALIFGTLASSMWVDGLKISTFAKLFSGAMDSITASPFTLTSLLDIGKVGGGFVGYFFAAVFLSGLGNIGTAVFCYLFLIAAVFLIFRIPAMSIYEDMRDYSARRSARRREIGLEEKSAEAPEKEKKAPVPPVREPVNDFSPFQQTTFTPKDDPEADENPDEPLEEEIKPGASETVSPLGKAYSAAPKDRKEKTVVFESNIVTPDEQEKAKKSLIGLSPFTVTGTNDGSSSASEVPHESAPKTEPTAPFKTEPTVPVHTETSVPDTEEKDEEELSRSARVINKTLYKDEENEDDLNAVPDVPDEGNSPAPGFVPKREEPAHASVPDTEAPSSPATDKSPVTLRAPDPDNLYDRAQGINETYDYVKPSIDLLEDRKDYSKLEANRAAAESEIPVINGVYEKLGIAASVQDYTIGPSVTRFNITREPGTRVSAIISSDVEQEMQIDLRGDMSVRLEAVVPGRNTSGVEVGNAAPMPVSFHDAFGAVLENPNQDPMLVPLGMDIDRRVVCVSFDSLPHLLVSGTTGSGKSVFIHQIIMTLIMRNYPSDLKLILVDPKKVEFNRYASIPHLLCPIITDIGYAVAMLKRLVEEMERRYTILSRFECSNIHDYNKIRKEKKDSENLPNILVVIDEFADMMGQNPKDVDMLTQRLAQKARAAGIYLLISTQRPSVKVITGTIKANIPARIALSLPSVFDSRTILDEGGAEKLLGKGDLLARIPSLKTTLRLQSSYVSNEEISRVASYLRSKGEPHYSPAFMNITEAPDNDSGDEGETGKHLPGLDDELYPDIKAWVMSTRIASTSALQRNFGIGYSRAASVLDALESEGIVRTVNGNKREVVKFEDDDGTGINTGE